MMFARLRLEYKASVGDSKTAIPDTPFLPRVWWPDSRVLEHECLRCPELEGLLSCGLLLSDVLAATATSCCVIISTFSHGSLDLVEGDVLCPNFTLL